MPVSQDSLDAPGEPRYSNQDLCANCVSLDFEALRNRKLESHVLYDIMEVGALDDTWTQRSCPFCRLLYAIYGDDDIEQTLWMMSSRNLSRYSVLGSPLCYYDGQESPGSGFADKQFDEYHSNVLVLNWTSGHRRVDGSESGDVDLSGRGGYLGASYDGVIFIGRTDEQQNTTVRGHKIEPTVSDFSQVKMWLDFCDCEHSTTCQPSQSKVLPGFQLLNCETGQLEPGRLEQDYVALSYVWGFKQGNTSTPESGEMPQTVKDAMFVVRQLGMNYLWVDRYCIPQHNKPAKYDQISNMDSIYGCASLTIVAASGDCASSGLSGISVPRPAQPRIRIGEHELIASLQNPSFSIKSSRKRRSWIRRGWTYQEGILSARCLYFTVEQIYLECQSKTYQESIDDPSAVMLSQTSADRLAKAYAREFERGEIYRVFPVKPVAHFAEEPVQILKRIAEYTDSRHLTYQSDALNAFLGILSRFVHPRFQTSSIWGVPILWTVNDWTFEEGFAAGLCWATTEWVEEVREAFPTWSWIAWDTSIGDPDSHYLRGISCPPDFSFTFETSAGDPISWRDSGKHYNCSSLSRFMTVESWVVDAELTWAYHYNGRSNRPKAVLILQNFQGTVHAEATVLANESTWAGEGNQFLSDVPERIDTESGEDERQKRRQLFTVRKMAKLQKRRCKVLIVGNKSPCLCNDALKPSFSDSEEEANPLTAPQVKTEEGVGRAPTKPFLMIIQLKGDHYQRIGSANMRLNVVDSNFEQFPDSTDISWVFTDARWEKIRLG